MSRKPYHSKTIAGKKRAVHRIVMETHLGRDLEPEEHVYHLNGDSQDNRLENLAVIRKKTWRPKKWL